MFYFFTMTNEMKFFFNYLIRKHEKIISDPLNESSPKIAWELMIK